MNGIVGIGSCLSEKVARHYGMNFGGETLCLVRHNRSEQVLSVLNGRPPPSLEKLTSFVEGLEGNDPSNAHFLLSQSIEGMGRSTKPDLLPIGAAIERRDVGLVLIDNFMDLTANVWRVDKQLFFARLPRGCGLKRVVRLAPDIAAKNYQVICARAQRIWPNAKVVFLHFPFAPYPMTTNKPEWGARFLEELSLPKNIYNISPVEIPDSLLKNRDPHHYHHSVYKQIAALVHERVAPSIGYRGWLGKLAGSLGIKALIH